MRFWQLRLRYRYTPARLIDACSVWEFFFGCFLVLSEDAANSAGVDVSELSLRSTEVRGRDAEVAVYAIDDPRAINVP